MAVPTSTYRLQIRQQFPLSAAAEVADYLKTLGADAVYLSPILQATSGSDHGYDLTSHDRVDPERGGEQGRLDVVAKARELGLEVVVDIVPNHMGVADAAQNKAWWELLRLGSEGEHAAWFDVDWKAGGGRIKLPVLGDDFTDDQLTLEDGELRYFEHRFPIAPGTAPGGATPAEVHGRQHYELVSYRRADAEQNYRRFFAVTDLAGIRVENRAVFDATHAELLRWVSTGGVDGIRIDHPDGLANPAEYLEWLAAAAPDSWITVEKITEPGELLPEQWPVAGTTGYDALAEVNSLLYDPADEATASSRYRSLTGDDRDWGSHVAQGKRLVATTILHAELLRIGRAVRAAAPDLADGDELVVAALTELAVAFPVYRSYQPVGNEQLRAAVQLATSRKPELAGTFDALLPLLAGGDREVTVRFEQATGAIMAKGVEDTAYYRYNRAIGLNEVGGDPGSFGSTVAEFHAAQEQRQRLLPESMTTLSTHDTKRSEDVRARVAVLPELGERWYAAAEQLMQRCPLPDQSFGYLLWQTFVGAGWIEPERMHAYAEKAMREASAGTGWRDSDADFEAAVHAVVDRAYVDKEIYNLLDDLMAEVTPHGWSNSLSQKLVQLTMPGIPDVYQGTELFDYSLVDPDNRRPVDFDLRRQLLSELDSRPAHSVNSGRSSTPGLQLEMIGKAKLWLTACVLRLRRLHPDRFSSYTPLTAAGEAAEHVVAFDRGGAITVATRLPVGLQRAGGWHDTAVTLPNGRYRDDLTGHEYSGTVEVAVLLADYPVALLALSD
ncbi:malto-oligosyltrehalose synthase [Jatrophihabitans lederbergiae]|uniref:Malto-oligosyltrehalose synthase n=1 Tax=Jatrophihabitans lederbergiae TaxID=3075547 RepID=A0ABU2J498_9ACTN|nr:malto-oligosyltrehalose synthase [Jatrophihabitans sp. DSM 44399]MDT0259822.1 malto-oligosyltrehalose synthase [Jatrophihabitans sp. DSM 44399]